MPIAADPIGISMKTNYILDLRQLLKGIAEAFLCHS
jgi:nitrite reductase/ring-hydroxylating ferredoxin subunit